MQHCIQCHPRGAEGLASAINDKPLPGFMIRLQVRHGFNVMPSFSKRHLSDTDLDNIVAYLMALRKADYMAGSRK